MIFAKTHLVNPDTGEARTDVIIKVDTTEIMVRELQSVIETAIDSDHTDLDVSVQIAEILEVEVEKLAKKGSRSYGGRRSWRLKYLEQ